jgi:hypothetical protein
MKPCSALLQPLPRHVWLLAALYFCASLIHFSHNAAYIAYYPNMPAWVTGEDVYLVWFAISGVGLAALACFGARWRTVGAILLAVYGGLGLDGLGHYALALCSEHTLAMNLTILFEVAAGAALAIASAVFAVRLRSAVRLQR